MYLPQPAYKLYVINWWFKKNYLFCLDIAKLWSFLISLLYKLRKITRYDNI